MEGLPQLLGSLLLLVGLLAGAFVVFSRVGSDYRTRGRLSAPIAVLQTGYFFIYASSSYAFLDSRLAHIGARGWVLALAVACMLLGFAVVVLAMPFLGKPSFGHQVGNLRTSGIYLFSRNPQLVGGFLFIVGYAMLWPSWMGAGWAALWLAIAALMVRAEEEHLESTFGDEFRAYCARTPRYLGLPHSRPRSPSPH